MSVDIIFSAEEVSARVEALGFEIAEAIPERLLAVPIMTGAFIFAADLLRALYHAGVEPEVDFLQVASYGEGTTSSGHVEFLREVQADVTGRDVLLIDDIFDTGNTLWELLPQIDELGPTSVRTAVLLRKEGRCEVPIKPHHVAFEIPNVFVVGYGLDYQDMYRNLPYVAEMEPADLAEPGR